MQVSQFLLCLTRRAIRRARACSVDDGQFQDEVPPAFVLAVEGDGEALDVASNAEKRRVPGTDVESQVEGDVRRQDDRVQDDVELQQLNVSAQVDVDRCVAEGHRKNEFLALQVAAAGQH